LKIAFVLAESGGHSPRVALPGLPALDLAGFDDSLSVPNARAFPATDFPPTDGFAMTLCLPPKANDFRDCGWLRLAL
jgi:hypothetical protein